MWFLSPREGDFFLSESATNQNKGTELRKIFAIIALLSTQTSWGLDALDGRQLVCKALPSPTFPIIGIQGLRFVGRQVKGDVVLVDNDTVIIKHFKTGPIKRIGLRKVEFWENNGTYWELDRTSLILQPDYVSDKFSSFQCDLAESLKDYNVRMEEHRMENLEALQIELKKNKI